MKYLIILFLLAVTVKSQAQVDSTQFDSTQMRASLTLQARDWLFVSEYVKYDDNFERLYDSIKSRIYPLTNSNSTTIGKIDSISVANLLSMANKLRSAPFAVTYFVFVRINTAIRAVNNSYLQNQMDIIDQNYTNQYNQGIASELIRLKKVHQ